MIIERRVSGLLILATLGRFPAREEVIDFSNIYFWGTSNVLVPVDSPVQELSDLAGETLLIVKGLAHSDLLVEIEAVAVMD
mgnify:CR=1 FL=1